MVRKHFIAFFLLQLSFFGVFSGQNSHENKAANYSGIQFGLCHAGNSKSSKEYSLIHNLEAKWLRIDFSWSQMEPEKGVWQFEKYDTYLEKAVKEGVKVLAILDYDANWIHSGKDQSRRIDPEELPDFLNYVEVVAKRYGDKVGGFEIWNEPNTNRFWTGSNKGFFELTKQSLTLLKELVPNTPIAVGAIFYHPVLGAKSYLKKMISAGVIDQADAISIHPYGVSIPLLAKRVEQAKKLIYSSGFKKPIWVTEIGFPTGGSYPSKVKLEEQASTVAKSIVQITKSGADMILWYCLFDSKKPDKVTQKMSSEAFFGLVWPNYKAKPGSIPYSLLAKELKGAEIVSDLYTIEGKKSSNIFQAKYKKEDGTYVVILWSIANINNIKIKEINASFVITDLLTGETSMIKNGAYFPVTKDPIMIHIYPI